MLYQFDLLTYINQVMFCEPFTSNAVLRSLYLLGLLSLGWYDLNLEGDEELQKGIGVFQV